MYTSTVPIALFEHNVFKSILSLNNIPKELLRRYTNFKANNYKIIKSFIWVVP